MTSTQWRNGTREHPAAVDARMTSTSVEKKVVLSGGLGTERITSTRVERMAWAPVPWSPVPDDLHAVEKTISNPVQAPECQADLHKVERKLALSRDLP